MLGAFKNAKINLATIGGTHDMSEGLPIASAQRTVLDREAQVSGRQKKLNVLSYHELRYPKLDNLTVVFVRPVLKRLAIDLKNLLTTGKGKQISSWWES